MSRVADACGRRDRRDRDRARGALACRGAHAGGLRRRPRRRALHRGSTSTCTRRSGCSSSGCPPDIALESCSRAVAARPGAARAQLRPCAPSSPRFPRRTPASTTLGPLHDAHVRPDAAARDRGVHLADRAAAGCAGAATGISSSASRSGASASGSWAPASTTTSRAGARSPDPRELVGPVRGLGGRPRRLGRRSRSASLPAPWIVRRSGSSVRLIMDAVAPGLLLAQGIGRWGNWWNQELYGKHTTLPWALKIDAAHAPGRRPGAPSTRRSSTSSSGTCSACWRPALDRPPLPHPPAGALRALRLVLHGLPLLRGDAADRPVAPRRRACGSTSGSRSSCSSPSTAFFVWWQFVRASPGAGPAARRQPRPIPKGPAMAVPEGPRPAQPR